MRSVILGKNKETNFDLTGNKFVVAVANSTNHLRFFDYETLVEISDIQFQSDPYNPLATTRSAALVYDDNYIYFGSRFLTTNGSSGCRKIDRVTKVMLNVYPNSTRPLSEVVSLIKIDDKLHACHYSSTNYAGYLNLTNGSYTTYGSINDPRACCSCTDYTKVYIGCYSGQYGNFLIHTIGTTTRSRMTISTYTIYTICTENGILYTGHSDSIGLYNTSDYSNIALITLPYSSIALHSMAQDSNFIYYGFTNKLFRINKTTYEIDVDINDGATSMYIFDGFLYYGVTSIKRRSLNDYFNSQTTLVSSLETITSLIVTT